MSELPFVIDNRTARLDQALDRILADHAGRCVDIATAYFSVRGYQLTAEGLAKVGHFRLLLGSWPASGEDIGIHLDPRAGQVRLEDLAQGTAGLDAAILRRELERAPLDQATQKLIEDLIRFLRQQHVEVRRYGQGFLHAKCWLFYGDQGTSGAAAERITPLLGVVGSSNFTAPGLTGNNELNLVHRVLLDDEPQDAQAEVMIRPLLPGVDAAGVPGDQRRLIRSEVGARAVAQLVDWYDAVWAESEDCKDALIDVLAESKFGEVEYTPFDIYLKALSRYFANEAEEAVLDRATAVELAEFQEDAVKRARRILARYSGVMVADSVGLGKTWIGKRLLEDYGYFQRQQVLVICPASLRSMWAAELRDATIPGRIISTESTGRQEFDPFEYGAADVILIDESHRLSNHRTASYEAIAQLVAARGGMGAAGERKKLILLTATPINNDLFDLYNQLSLITQGDDGCFAAAQIGDLRRYFLAARRNDRPDNLFNLLEEVVVRRPRSHIRDNYPNATINGEPIKWPERVLHTQHYSLAEVYGRQFYRSIVDRIEHLKLAPYGLENYRRHSDEVDSWEAGRQQALTGIFKSLYLKRFESSVEAFRLSIDRARSFLRAYREQMRHGRLLTPKEWRRLEALERDAGDSDRNGAAELLDGLEPADPDLYDLGQVEADIETDLEVLSEIAGQVSHIGPEQDAKWQALRSQLMGLGGQKVLIFSYFKDTARYLYRLMQDDGELAAALGHPVIRCADSEIAPRERDQLVDRFAPHANRVEGIAGTDREISLLVATDVLSEGKNLQDCPALINFDLHWAPTRMIQRSGRIDRIGTPFDVLDIHNYFPEQELEDLLGLVGRLQAKIEAIDDQGLHDVSVLGELPHPRAFNTLRRIEDEDASVIDEEERVAELASAEGLRAQLRAALERGYQQRLDQLPDGVHSCRRKGDERGIFFAFEAHPDDPERRRQFWVYRDHASGRFEDNRFRIAQLIACPEEEPRTATTDSVFDVLPQAVEHVLKSCERAAAMEAAAPRIDPEQTRARVALQEGLRQGGLDRPRTLGAIRFLNQPMLPFARRRIRLAYEAFATSNDIRALLDAVDDLRIQFQVDNVEAEKPGQGTVTEADLHLVCFEYIG